MLWLKIAAGVLACLLAAFERRRGVKLGEMNVDRFLLLLLLLGIAFLL